MHRNHRSFLGIFLFAGLLALGLSGCGSDAQSGAQAGQPPTVQVVPVEQRDVSLTSEWIATMDGYVNAQIQPHVSGYLVRQDYREGSVVRKGEVLFEIDPRPFQATLDQSSGSTDAGSGAGDSGSGAARQGGPRCRPRYSSRRGQGDRAKPDG